MIEQSTELVAKGREVGQARGSLTDVGHTPLSNEGILISCSVHGETSTCSDQPWVMISKTCLVCILASSYKRHIGVVNQVVKELGEELSQPPHADEIASSRVVLPLPVILRLGLITLLAVVVTVKNVYLVGDLFIDARV